MITVTKTIDPVCGMEVDTGSRFNSYYMGKAYYFCSLEDKLKFDKNPKQYATRARVQEKVGAGSR